MIKHKKSKKQKDILTKLTKRGKLAIQDIKKAVNILKNDLLKQL